MSNTITSYIAVIKWWPYHARLHASTTGNDLQCLHQRSCCLKVNVQTKTYSQQIALSGPQVVNNYKQEVKKFWQKAALLTSAVCPLHHPLAHATANERAGDCNVKPASCEHCIHWHTFRLNDVYTERAYTSLCVLRVPMQMVQMQMTSYFTPIPNWWFHINANVYLLTKYTCILVRPSTYFVGM